MLTQVVHKTGTIITINSDTNPSTFNLPVTFTATVSGTGGVPTGTVTFQDTFDGTTNTVGTGTLGPEQWHGNGDIQHQHTGGRCPFHRRRLRRRHDLRRWLFEPTTISLHCHRW